jgi:hypothetical protein
MGNTNIKITKNNEKGKLMGGGSLIKKQCYDLKDIDNKILNANSIYRFLTKNVDKDGYCDFNIYDISSLEFVGYLRFIPSCDYCNMGVYMKFEFEREGVKIYDNSYNTSQLSMDYRKYCDNDRPTNIDDTLVFDWNMDNLSKNMLLQLIMYDRKIDVSKSYNVVEKNDINYLNHMIDQFKFLGEMKIHTDNGNEIHMDIGMIFVE